MKILLINLPNCGVLFGGCREYGSLFCALTIDDEDECLCSVPSTIYMNDRADFVAYVSTQDYKKRVKL